MLENMLGEYKPTRPVSERERLSKVGCEIDTRRTPPVDIHPSGQYPRPAAEMKLYILHLQQGTFLRSHDRRYASPEADPSQMGLGPYILNAAKGYWAIFYDRTRDNLRPSKKQHISLLSL